MTVYQFVAHKSPGKSRIFALVQGDGKSLEAVTTLSGEDLHLTDALVGGLNGVLTEGKDDAIEGVLDRVPNAVRLAVRTFLREKSIPDLGSVNADGPIEIVRQAYFDDHTGDFEEYLAAAYMIGLGIRATNEIDRSGDVGWYVELRAEEVFVPRSGEPRTWPLPHGTPVLATWTTRDLAKGNPVTSPLATAKKASAEGHWVRLHTIEHGHGEDEFNGTTTSEFVVDVFDAPIPLDDELDE